MNVNIHPSEYQNTRWQTGIPPTVVAADPEPVKDRAIGAKIQLVVYAGLLFMILSNNVAYRFTNEMWAFVMTSKNELLGENGLPTIKGACRKPE